MSLSSLQLEVAELREEVDSLRVELTRLRRVVAELRVDRSNSSRVDLDSISEGSYSYVSERDSHYTAEQSVRETSRLTPSSYAGGSLPGSPGLVTETPSGPPCVLSWAQREAIADSIGHFLHRALSGDHRQSSGRDRIPLPSRIWIICRDFAGQIYTPVKVVRSWSSCRDLCKPRGVAGAPGDAVFVGLPSEREGRRAVASAGLVWPQAIEP